MNLLSENLPFILQGLGMTLALSATTLFFSTVVAISLGALAVSRWKSVRWIVRSAVELFRDIPLIVNVFFVFFGAPLLGLDLSPFVAVTVSLTLWGGTNGAEIVRGGLEAVPRHQLVSAQALGLKGWEVFALVRAPQALKSIIPPYVGLLTLIVQSTALGALVGVSEFLRVGQIIVERTTMTDGYSPAFAVYGAILLVYFVMCSAISWLGRHLERKLRRDSHSEPGAPTVRPAQPEAAL